MPAIGTRTTTWLRSTPAAIGGGTLSYGVAMNAGIVSSWPAAEGAGSRMVGSQRKSGSAPCWTSCRRASSRGSSPTMSVKDTPERSTTIVVSTPASAITLASDAQSTGAVDMSSSPDTARAPLSVALTENRGSVFDARWTGDVMTAPSAATPMCKETTAYRRSSTGYARAQDRKRHVHTAGQANLRPRPMGTSALASL